MERGTVIDIKKERERFLADPLISAFDDCLVRIHMVAIPAYVVSADNILMGGKYDPKTRALIESIEKERGDYIEAEYGISEGDKEWQ